jgi:hypothetical protein
MLWLHRLAHVSLKGLEILAKVLGNVPKMAGKCHYESRIKCKLARNPFTLNASSRATEPLQLVDSDICGQLATAI